MENLVVDGAYRVMGYSGDIVVKIDDEFYLLPALNRTSNDLTKFKKLPESIVKKQRIT